MNDVTIYSIAKETGVSPSTVSRVLNNNPHVSKETRAKVLKALDTTGFIPNDTARNLVNKSSMMIGVLVSDIRENQQSNTLFTIDQVFAKEGYSCLIYNTGHNPEGLQHYVRLLSQKKVDGVLLMGSTYQSEEVQNAITKYFSRIPVIVVNGHMDGENVYSIYCDMRTGMHEVVELFLKKGRHHLGFVYASENSGFKDMEDSIRQNLYGKDNVDFFSMQTERRPEEVSERIAELLKLHPETDGLVFADDYLAIAGMRGLVDSGKRIPEHIAVIGISNSRYTRICNPRLTSLDTMLYDCALTFVRTMLQLLHDEYVPKTMMSPRLVEREST